MFITRNGWLKRWWRLPLWLLLIDLQAAAHHSAAIYDHTRERILVGAVVRLDWANPHVYIQVQTNDGTLWAIEAGTPNFLASLGWSPTTLSSGERVTVRAYPAKRRDKQMALGLSIVKENGTLLGIRGDSIPAALLREDSPTAAVANTLSGRWLTRWTPSSPLLQSRVDWPLTALGQAALEAYDVSQDPARNCRPQTAPLLMVWPDVKDISIGRDEIVIRYERDGMRTIYMNVDSHEGMPHSDQGHSIGRWEGDDLIVDTANFNEHRTGHGLELSSGRQKHLLERFSLSRDGTSFEYTFQVEDPEYLTSPVTGTLEFVYRPDLHMVNLPCDPEVARRGFEN